MKNGQRSHAVYTMDMNWFVDTTNVISDDCCCVWTLWFFSHTHDYDYKCHISIQQSLLWVILFVCRCRFSLSWFVRFSSIVTGVYRLGAPCCAVNRITWEMHNSQWSRVVYSMEDDEWPAVKSNALSKFHFVCCTFLKTVLFNEWMLWMLCVIGLYIQELFNFSYLNNSLCCSSPSAERVI